MFNTKNAITVLLIVLGLTLFYLWYSTWHRNISTNSLNKQLIQDNVHEPNNTNTPILPPAVKQSANNSVSSQSNTENQINPPPEKKNDENTKSEENSNQNTENKTANKTENKLVNKKPIRLVKSNRKHTTKPRPIRKPAVSKPVVKPPVVKKPIAPSLPITNKSLKLYTQKNIQSPKKYIRLENGTYQAGAFKSFADALSLSLELKAEGKHAKIIHQNGFYKVIAY